MTLALTLLLCNACNRSEHPAAPATPRADQGDPARGKLLVAKFACTTCHVIPGIEGEGGAVGPSLAHVATRPIIGRHLNNTPENISRWLQNPQAVDPDTMMPTLGITAPESRDLAAFLQTLR